MLVAVLVGGALTAAITRNGSYQLEILMPSADGTFAGDDVVMAGRKVGTVRAVTVRERKALVTVSISGEYAPLHYGTTGRVAWESALTNRFVELISGPATNPEIPSGNRIESHIERVELDHLLATLDPKTLQDVNSLVQQLNQTVHGSEPGLNATLRTAGPAALALGEVLKAVGSDGPAIRELISKLRELTSTLARRDQELGATVHDLHQFTSVTARQQQALSDGLAELPTTVDAAKAALDRVPPAVDETVPLLEDLLPATQQLPAVAGNLNPVLQELRPTVAELRPTLVAARSLLGHTPDLLDSAHGVMPDMTETVTRLQPAVAFLRPYTPELAGWFSNWTGIFAPEDGTGNYARALITESGSSVGGNPGVIPPGLEREPAPVPGSLVDQPWTDAAGGGIR